MKYLIKLTPTGSYFFGGETTFGERGNEKSKHNYLVKSNQLPQASTIFGLVRYEILRKNNLLDYNKKELKKDIKLVEQLIGKQGFSLINKEDFGIINNISPVFLCKGDEYFTAMPLDEDMPIDALKLIGKEKKGGYELDVKFDNNVRCSYGSNKFSKTVNIDGFNPKHYYNYLFWISNNRKIILAPFRDCMQVGILKNGRDESEKESFFKQQLIRLVDGYSFAFVLETNSVTKLKDVKELSEVNQQPVYIGGNSSLFLMSISKMTNVKPEPKFDFTCLIKENRRLLIGDAYLTKEQLDTFAFVWGMAIPFRYVDRSTQCGYKWGESNKSADLYYLLPRGSVIYGNEDDLAAIEIDALKKLGLNNII